MNRSSIFALAALVLFIAAGVFTYRSLASDNDKPAPTRASESSTATPAPKRASAAKDEAPPSYSMPAMVDDDPVGKLLLEGQAVDENGIGVAGATVILGSAPPRTTTSEADGSFSFDKLISRRYPVTARSADRVGGPVIVMLSESSDPVLVHMQPGGGLEIEVVDSGERPIAGATVTMPELREISVQTDAEGIAILPNLPPGHGVVAATAEGFAKTSSIVTVPRDAEARGRQRLTLLAGTAVSGTVFTPDGKPLAQAYVLARPVGTLVQIQDPRRDGVQSDKDGRFTLPAVPAGGTQLFAVHDDYAPTTGERFSVADSALTDIDLKMREGAWVSGRVQTKEGQAAAWATLRVVSANPDGPGGGGLHRQMITEEDGSFKMKGLPQQAVLVHASNETASSTSLQVDLRSKPRAQGLELVLDVAGEIRGVVVDETGEPVAEAQVLAVPDFWEGADMESVRVRGPVFATTAGDGSFVLRGLPELKVRVIASRGKGSPAGTDRGVPAQTGDTDVKVVLAAPGRILGKIQQSDGSAPGHAVVSLGWETGVPTKTGRFEIGDVPPGRYELSVRGPDFATTHRSGVELAAGETLDIGTIVVESGRAVTGRVLHQGRPVAGAQVVLARQLISDGSSLTPRELGDVMDQSTGIRRATSDEKGNYRFGGIGKAEWTIAADHPDTGRSVGAVVPAGADDAAVDLELREVGSVRGRVTVNGQPAPNIQVLLTATQSASQHILVVSTDERGTYFAERVASGEHKVSAMQQAAGASSMAATTTVVQAGKEAVADLNIEEGAVTLDVTVVGESDASIDAAQVFLFKGIANVTTGAELNKLFLSAAANAKMSFAMSNGKAAFEKVVPDSYSLCVIPINGDMNDPAFAQKLQRHVNELAVYCERLDVTEAPEKQSHRAVVPPMTPLPEE